MKLKYPVNSKNSDAYQQLFAMGKERGFKMAWSSLRFFKKNKFTHYVVFDGKKWVKVRKSIRPDFIYEKSVFKYERVPIKQAMASAAPFLNPVELQIIASDKMLTYLTFPDIVYPMVSVGSKNDIANALKIIKSKKVVVKPLIGAGGRGIEFFSRSKVKNFNPKEPYVMQEFIDCARGIPKIYNGVHDFRLLFLGNKLFHAFYRTAAPGTLLCNVTQGGLRVVVPLSKVPKKLKKMASVIQKRFTQFSNSFYSVDFIYNERGVPKIIEINSSSGLDNAPGYDRHLTFLYKKILDHIEKFV